MMTHHKQRNWRRAAVALLVAALSLAFTGAASAQAFNASVTSTLVRGGGTLPSGGCSNGAYSCGTANIAGYGAASWNLYPVPTSIVETACGSTYTALTYFTLLSDPTSTLVLSEGGNLCGLGADGAGYRGYFNGRFPKDYGRPYSAVGAWTTVTTDCSAPSPIPGEPTCSTGQFAGKTGTGTDTLDFAGAQASGSYSGTLG